MAPMQFGDRPAANILSEALHVISNDASVSDDCRNFIQCSYYVDDGGQSSNSKEKIDAIANELPGIFSKYNFGVKHVLKSYESNIGSTNTSNSEIAFGLIWNCVKDELCPVISVHLGKKKRGLHVDEELTCEVIDRTNITLRMLLRVCGSLFDLSGRFLGPLIFKTRLIYSQASKLNAGWDVGLKDVDSNLYSRVTDVLYDIVKVRNTIQPMGR